MSNSTATQPDEDLPAVPMGECEYCGRDNVHLVIDGRWCRPQCQFNDRASETTWRRAVAA